VPENQEAGGQHSARTGADYRHDQSVVGLQQKVVEYCGAHPDLHGFGDAAGEDHLDATINLRLNAMGPGHTRVVEETKLASTSDGAENRSTGSSSGAVGSPTPSLLRRGAGGYFGISKDDIRAYSTSTR